MNYKDIERIAELEECSNLEFKESTGQLDRSMETLCAFLNGDGGDILYGIKDNGKIIGQEVSDNTKRSIAEAVNRIEPFVELEISAQFKFSVASPRGANQKMVQHDTG